jgi:chromatin remodeling complex protein RSC6
MQTRSGKTYTTSSSLEKNQTKVNKNVDNHVPGQPREISNQLAKLFGKPAGTKMLGSSFIYHVYKYVDDNNLVDPVNRGRIIPDSKLAALLKLGKNEEVRYTNIAVLLKHHFM